MPSKYQISIVALPLTILGTAAMMLNPTVAAQAPPPDPIMDNAQRMLNEGKTTFRFETFGDEAFWGDTIKLHQAVAGSKLGGVGTGVSPRTALSVGLKVDVDALPDSLR